MAVSKTQIFNGTLRLLGSQRITSYDDNVPRAKTLVDIYDIARRDLLSDGRYSFARTRYALTLKATTPAFGYAYEFELPPNWLSAISEESDYPYEVEGDSILSDSDVLQLKYVKDVTDTSLFSPGYVNLLMHRMAMDGCKQITGSNDLLAILDKQYKLLVLSASSNDASQDNQDIALLPNVFVNARR